MGQSLCYFERKDDKQEMQVPHRDTVLLADQTAQLLKYEASLTSHNSKESAKIDLVLYMRRFLKYLELSSETITIAYIYMHRVAANLAHMQIDSENVHLLMALCLCVAQKYHIDTPRFSNLLFAKVAGVQLEKFTVNETEIIVDGLKWQCAFTVEEYMEAQRCILGFKYQYKKRK